MIEETESISIFARLNYGNSFKVFILSLIGTCETSLMIILGGMDSIAKILLITIVLEVITTMVLDYVKNGYFRNVNNFKLIRKFLIILTVGLSVLADTLISQCGLGIKLGDMLSLRTYTMLHWICIEGINTLDNIDKIGETTGKWSSPTLLKDIYKKFSKKK